MNTQSSGLFFIILSRKYSPKGGNNLIGWFLVFSTNFNCIGGVIVSMLASIAVGCGFEPRSGQTKDYKIGICCFSAKQKEQRLVGSESG
jgi:hypothetical protein